MKLKSLAAYNENNNGIFYSEVNSQKPVCMEYLTSTVNTTIYSYLSINNQIL